MGSSTISTISVEEYQALVTNIPLQCPNATFTVAGRTFTAPQAVTFLQTVLTAVAAVATAKVAVKTAQTAAEEMMATDGAAAKGIRETIGLMYSNNPTILAAFKVAPKKARQPLSTAARAAATAKGRATRPARGTKGKKQKVLAHTGDRDSSGISMVVLRAVA